MTKANVNTASREELIEAGVRTDVADEIMKLRRKGKITSPDALDQIAGVGPVTLEQLRKVLDFRDRSEDEARQGREQVRAGEREVEQAAERTAEAASSTVRVAADTSGAATRQGAEVARSATEAAASTARGGLQVVQQATRQVAEGQREAVRQSAEGTTDVGKLLVDLLNEQTKHNVEIAVALGRAVDWEQVVRAQADFMRASLERMSRLNSRYLELLGAMTGAAMSAAGQDRRDRAA